jgi:hypothetical protein
MPPDVPRKPLRAALSGTPGERRLKRLKPPPCPGCGHEDVRVNLRTEYALYFVCNNCLRIWSAMKPGFEGYGT